LPHLSNSFAALGLPQGEEAQQRLKKGLTFLKHRVFLSVRSGIVAAGLTIRDYMTIRRLYDDRPARFIRRVHEAHRARPQ
jgi:hypothetical protein